MKKILFLLPLSLLAVNACNHVEVEEQQRKDFSYCLQSDDSYPLPTLGDVRNISISLSLQDDSIKELKGFARCEYVASMCEDHFRIDLWHGNQDQEHPTLNLSSGHQLIFVPHGACLQLSDYLKNCPDENCNASEQFEILVMLPQRSPDRKMVPYSELSDVIGSKILNLEVTLTTEPKD